MGVPVVVSDLGASAETVVSPPDALPAQRTGWLVPAANRHALAMAIGEALNMREAAREALSLRARAHVRERFSVERMCAATLSVYESLLEAAFEAAPTG